MSYATKNLFRFFIDLGIIFLRTLNEWIFWTKTFRGTQREYGNKVLFGVRPSTFILVLLFPASQRDSIEILRACFLLLNVFKCLNPNKSWSQYNTGEIFKMKIQLWLPLIHKRYDVTLGNWMTCLIIAIHQ